MTTETQSVLEKLKRYQDAFLQYSTAAKLFEAGKISEALKNAAANNFIDNQEALEEAFPRLIAMLEMVEAKAETSAFYIERELGERDFARELLAVLENKEAKDE